MSCIFKNCRGDFDWIFTGVYCRGNIVEKTIIWKELEECRTKWGGNWVIRGDFNMTLRKEERSDSSFLASEVNEFKEVMERLRVVDLPLSKGQWTWFNQNNLSILDLLFWLDQIHCPLDNRPLPHLHWGWGDPRGIYPISFGQYVVSEGEYLPFGIKIN